MSSPILPARRAKPLTGSVTVPRVRPRGRSASHAAETTPDAASQLRFVPTRRDPLGRLLSQLVQLAGPNAFVTESVSRPWASATFVGAQHTLMLCIDSPDEESEGDTPGAAEHFALALPEAEFHIPGHIVADIVIDERRSVADRSAAVTHFRITALTIEDW